MSQTKISDDAKEQLLGWLKFAIELEDKGLEFYKECRTNTHHARAIELFDFLIKVEKGHKKALQTVLDAYTQGDTEKAHQAVHAFMRLDMEPPVFKKEDLEKMTSPYTALHEMFNIALKMEKEGMDFYRKVEAEATDESIRNLFNKLANEEVEHFREIKELGSFVFGMNLVESDEV